MPKYLEDFVRIFCYFYKLINPPSTNIIYDFLFNDNKIKLEQTEN